MIYIYDKVQLQFNILKPKHFLIAILVMIGTHSTSFILGYIQPPIEIQLESGIVIINNSIKVFSEESLVNKISDLNLRFPHIVLAQSILETGHWTSTIFKENHNLFGMKEAQQRVKTSLGTQLNHAYYCDWESSLYDYAFYQARYMSKAKTEDQYFQALGQTYAESPTYVQDLKRIIEKEKLKKLFK